MYTRSNISSSRAGRQEHGPGFGQYRRDAGRRGGDRPPLRAVLGVPDAYQHDRPVPPARPEPAHHGRRAAQGRHRLVRPAAGVLLPAPPGAQQGPAHHLGAHLARPRSDAVTEYRNVHVPLDGPIADDHPGRTTGRLNNVVPAGSVIHGVQALAALDDIARASGGQPVFDRRLAAVKEGAVAGVAAVAVPRHAHPQRRRLHRRDYRQGAAANTLGVQPEGRLRRTAAGLPRGHRGDGALPTPAAPPPSPRALPAPPPRPWRPPWLSVQVPLAPLVRIGPGPGPRR